LGPKKLLISVGIAVLAGALPAVATASPPANIVKLMRKGGEYARDCTSLSFLDANRPKTVRYVVWCGVQTGKVRFSVHRDGGAPVLAFPHRIAAAGAGAQGSFRCQRVVQAVKCEGTISGPVVVRGWITVPGRRCVPVAVHNPGEGRAGIAPQGCPGTHRLRPPHDGRYIREFRHSAGLDYDLHGDKAAIHRRIVGLIKAWERGNPVERATEAEWTVPMSARDQREFEYQNEYIERDSNAIELWAKRHAPATFAGWGVDEEAGGIFYIGFVGDQEARIAEFESQVKVLAPERIKPFPTPPRYTEDQLEELQEEIDRQLFVPKRFELISSVWIDVLGNTVVVGSEHVAKTRKFLDKRFGTEAPIRVVFERLAMLA
jgi:hypothetical protein